MTAEQRKIVFASSAGTIFEWYDFYLYGALAATLGTHFFSNYPEATRNIFTLLAFASGFLVRPLGALVFGRLGDTIGRKYAFLLTIVVMGTSTFLIGLLPSYETIGIAAPLILVALRLVQGLALGGEYGGAAVFVAEHAPPGRRGYFTSWIQTTASLGLLLSLVLISWTQITIDANFSDQQILVDGTPTTVTAFAAWGWRIPFLLSILLLIVSVYIRLELQESPAFRRLKNEGRISKAPLREAFGRWSNARNVLAALFGLVAGQAVVWYTSQFYALFFLQSVLEVDQFTANILMAWGLTLGAGSFLVFGALSDRIGRKPIILGGCLIAALAYFPLFQALTATANPALYRAQQTVPVVVTADPKDCSFQFNPIDWEVKLTSSCDIAKAMLARNAVSYETVAAPASQVATVKIGRAEPIAADDPDFAEKAAAQLKTAGYPTPDHPDIVRIAIDPAQGFLNLVRMFDIFTVQKLTIIGILAILIVFVAMVYGPIAAALVELFPTRIRYTSVSLPYHVGNGWLGGLLPAAAFAMSAQAGNVYYGLWYPVAVALGTVLIGLFFVPDARNRDVAD